MTTPEDVLEAARRIIVEQRQELSALELDLIRGIVAAKSRTVSVHLYISSACQHALHDGCALTCKVCKARCLCPCHLCHLPK